MHVRIRVYSDDQLLFVSLSRRANKASLTRKINDLKRSAERWYPDCSGPYRLEVYVDGCHYCSVLFDQYAHHCEVFYD